MIFSAACCAGRLTGPARGGARPGDICDDYNSQNHPVIVSRKSGRSLQSGEDVDRGGGLSSLSLAGK